jgi:hypothetical protein
MLVWVFTSLPDALAAMMVDHRLAPSRSPLAAASRGLPAAAPPSKRRIPKNLRPKRFVALDEEIGHWFIQNQGKK